MEDLSRRKMNQNHLDDWELLLLPDEEINEDEERVCSNKILIYSSSIFNFQADYFICPQFVDNNNSVKISPPNDDDPVSEVFFNNHQSEGTVIRLDSPKSIEMNMGSSIVVDPDQIEFQSPFHLDIMGYDDYETQSCSRHGNGWDFKFDIWKWSASAISSLGVALCIIIFSSKNSRDLPHSQKLQFCSYPQAKNRGVHQASMIMAVRGGEGVTRARIICGGCYKGAI